MFKTLEELKEKYPLGTKLNYVKTTHSQNFFYARPEDLEIFRREFKKAEVIDDKFIKCTWDVEDYDSVDGYLFDGTHWWPAENTWDGWVPIKEEDE